MEKWKKSIKQGGMVRGELKDIVTGFGELFIFSLKLFIFSLLHSLTGLLAKHPPLALELFPPSHHHHLSLPSVNKNTKHSSPHSSFFMRSKLWEVFFVASQQQREHSEKMLKSIFVFEQFKSTKRLNKSEREKKCPECVTVLILRAFFGSTFQTNVDSFAKRARERESRVNDQALMFVLIVEATTRIWGAISARAKPISKTSLKHNTP